MRLVVAILVIVSSTLTGIASAQDVSDEAPAATEAYEQHLRDALAEYEAGHYQEARALFNRAHSELPNARTLRGIGMASFGLREYVESIRRLEEALAHDVRPLTDAQRTSTRALIDRARTFVGRYVVEATPESATIFVDDADAEVDEDGAILLDLGDHTFELRCADCASVSRRVTVRGGEDERLVLDGTRTDSTTTLPPDDPPEPQETDDGGRVSVAGVALLATAGALAGGAAVAGVWWAGRGDEVKLCEDAGDACRNLDTLQGEQTAAGAVTIALIGSAVIAATVGVIMLVSGGDDEGQASIACAPSLMGVGCVGSF